MESQTEGKIQITINSFSHNHIQMSIMNITLGKLLHQKTHSQRPPNMLKNSIYQQDKQNALQTSTRSGCQSAQETKILENKLTELIINKILEIGNHKQWWM